MGEDAETVDRIARFGSRWPSADSVIGVGLRGAEGMHAWVVLPPSEFNTPVPDAAFKPVVALGEAMQARFAALVGPVMIGHVAEDGERIPLAEDLGAHRAAMSWAASSTGDERLYLAPIHVLDGGATVAEEPSEFDGPMLVGPVARLRAMLMGEPMGGSRWARRMLAWAIVRSMRRDGYTVEVGRFR